MIKVSDNKVFIKNTIMQYIMIVAQYIFPLLTFPYLTRILKPDTYGIITYMTATVSYFQILIDFGFNLSSTKSIAEHQNDYPFVGKLLGTTMQAKAMIALLSIAGYSVMIPLIDILRENILLAYLYLGTVLLNALLPDFLFRGIEKMQIMTYRYIVSKTITTILTFVLVRSKDDVALIPILSMAGTLIAAVMTWYEVKKLDIRMQFSDLKKVLKTLRESSVYFMSTFATTAYGATNTFMLGIMSLPSAQIAYWGVSYNLISTAQSLYTPILNSLYPRMAAKKDFKLVKNILYLFMPAIIVTTILVFVLSKYIILVFCGKEYIDSIPIFKALLPVLVFSFPGMILGFPVLGVMGKVKETTYTTIISSVFHVLGLAALAVTGRFTVLNVAVLRSMTEGVLLGSRYLILQRTRAEMRRGVSR